MIELCRRIVPRHGRLLAPLLLLLAAAAGHAANDAEQPANALKSVDYSVLPGNRVEIRFELAQPISDPRSFTIREPARIALDLPDTRNETGKRRIPMGVGAMESINIAEAQGRTRIVLNLSEIPQHRTRVEGNTVVLSLGGRQAATATAEGDGDAEADGGAGDTTAVPDAGGDTGEPFRASASDAGTGSGIRDISFRRGREGQGRVIVELAGPDVPINIEREGGDVVVDLLGTTIPADMRKRLDVLDFATPVQYVDILQRGERGRIRITPRTEDYEQLAYQSGSTVTVELKPLTEEEVAEQEAEKPEYTGEKLSLNFQDIEVRSVLQLLADFTGLNVVVSDSVSGSLTLRLKNVPWDQALDIILQSEGLGKRRNGNVIFVAPQQEIAAREQARLEARQQEQELAPLRTEYVQVNYAKASDLANILKSESSSLLSERASVTVDQRTNTLLLRATADNLEEARRLVSRLDVPVRQVLIESRIVVATDDFNRELGVRFGVHRDTTNDGQGAVLSNNSDQVDNLIDNDPIDNRYNVNLPVTNPAGSVALALAKLPFGTLLELELSALQAEGRGEIISTPRVITANQKEAVIEQGVEIPYQEASSSGATSVSFKKAVLSLGVTPQITPDDRIIMDLQVTNDTVGEVFAGVPSIDTREVQTQVLVDNGETVVLGGIYEQTKNRQVERVPFFSDLPVIGNLFKSSIQENDQSELLVFVTPKIVKGSTGLEN
ncbi:MAG: type IV pilus secretin PilQ [Halofilum sp. (in: g-proteobacteria)]|nr:type IV pilus secretin PilQ [Halofilum sp. (in: g-proteobacteria)]